MSMSERIRFISELEQALQTATDKCKKDDTKAKLKNLTEFCAKTIDAFTCSELGREREQVFFAFTAHMALEDEGLFSELEYGAEFCDQLFSSRTLHRTARGLSCDEKAFCVLQLQRALEIAKSSADTSTKSQMEVVETQAENTFHKYKKKANAGNKSGAEAELAMFAKAMVSVDLSLFDFEEQGFGTSVIANWLFEPVSGLLSKPKEEVSLEDKAYFLAQLQVVLGQMSYAARAARADKELKMSDELISKVRVTLDTYRSSLQRRSRREAKKTLNKFAEETADIDKTFLNKVRPQAAEVFAAWRVELLKKPSFMSQPDILKNNASCTMI